MPATWDAVRAGVTIVFSRQDGSNDGGEGSGGFSNDRQVRVANLAWGTLNGTAFEYGQSVRGLDDDGLTNRVTGEKAE